MKVFLSIMLALLTVVTLGAEQGNRFTEWRKRNNKEYKYKENDGVFVFYETKDKELYRKLLPKQFKMPKRLWVQLFVVDFYEIDSDAEPYKEVSLFLLAKHNGKEVWHCIFMPVTSRDSMIAGKLGLGLPKTMGEIEFTREQSQYTGVVIDHQQRYAKVVLDCKNPKMSKEDEKMIKHAMFKPRWQKEKILLKLI